MQPPAELDLTCVPVQPEPLEEVTKGLEEDDDTLLYGPAANIACRPPIQLPAGVDVGEVNGKYCAVGTDRPIGDIVRERAFPGQPLGIAPPHCS